jgi:hypothetical protein
MSNILIIDALNILDFIYQYNIKFMNFLKNLKEFKFINCANEN